MMHVKSALKVNKPVIEIDVDPKAYSFDSFIN